MYYFYCTHCTNLLFIDENFKLKFFFLILDSKWSEEAIGLTMMGTYIYFYYYIILTLNIYEFNNTLTWLAYHRDIFVKKTPKRLTKIEMYYPYAVGSILIIYKCTSLYKQVYFTSVEANFPYLYFFTQIFKHRKCIDEPINTNFKRFILI